MSSCDSDRDRRDGEYGDLGLRFMCVGCECRESLCSTVRGARSGARRVAVVTPVVLQAETCLSSVVLCLVLPCGRVPECSRGECSAVSRWCTILCDMFGCTLIEIIKAVLAGTRFDSRIQTRSSILVHSCVSLFRANVVL